MKILVINTGSSSIKYKLFSMPEEKVLSTGVAERIGEEKGELRFFLTLPHSDQREEVIRTKIESHQSGLHLIADALLNPEYNVLHSPEEISFVGHRVVHGGEMFREPVLITEEVIAQIRKLIPLAPLHNPSNLQGIQVGREVFPHAKQIAVFDTAYHQTIPAPAYRYAIPHQYYEQHGLRVYGMHGTSHQYVAQSAAQHLQKDIRECNFISIHLGNGCSMTAIRGGESIDTSMGFSPLPGLVMGSRSGDIDPALVLFLARQLHMSIEEIDHMLNKESGLKGLTGSNDLRDIVQREQEGDQHALLALEMYTYRIKKYIGSYYAVLGRPDAIIFTAGVGENSALVRERSCQGLQHLGINLDTEKNSRKGAGIKEIQADDSLIRILVIPTDEELSIAQQAYQLYEEKENNTSGPGE